MKLAETMQTEYNISARTISLDDLYLRHEELVAIRKSHSENALLYTRGQPGTHDENLAMPFFKSLQMDPLNGEFEENKVICYPSFDKSRFNGEGDRMPEENWECRPKHPMLKVLIFEGWCVGFKPLANEDVESKWANVRSRWAEEKVVTDANHAGDYEKCVNTLSLHKLSDIITINDNLRRYYETFMGPDQFHGFIHLTTENIANVYQWRIQQERHQIIQKGSGMTDIETIRFVRVYMPAYELYLDELQGKPFFEHDSSKTHLRITLDVNRNITRKEKMGPLT
jgi:D-glycerate 3-kinase